MQKYTKIIATISDRRCSEEFLTSLFNEGMNVVRLNTAHQDRAAALKVIENTRKVSDRIALLIDTKGPEVRTVNIPENIEVAEGEKINLVRTAKDAVLDKFFEVSYANFIDDIELGASVLIDDGELELKVVEKFDNYLVLETQNAGAVKNKKSINVPGGSFNLPSLSEKDLDFIDFAIEQNIDFIAHSFVRKKEDVIEIQKILDAKDSKIKIIAKIENQEGVDNIKEILDYAYGVMVARGDLAIEIPAERIPTIQRKIMHLCRRRKAPVIVATQMLHTMIDNPRPTRAEVSDIANAIYNRTDAIMLSGETAYGDYPVESVRTMKKVAVEVEKELESDLDIELLKKTSELTAIIAKSAVESSIALPIKAVITDTLTGRTARYISAFRGDKPVYAMCYSKRVMRELSLSYGIEAGYAELSSGRDEYVKSALLSLMDKKYLCKDNSVVITGGSFGPSRGVNFMEISKVEDLIK